MKVKPLLFISIPCFIFFVQITYSQESSALSLDYKIGRSEVIPTDYYELHTHFGKTVQLGISYNQLNDRLHISPHGSITFYDAKRVTDTPDQYINEFRAGISISYDVILYQQFRLFVQPGIDYAIFKGLTGTGGWITRTKSEYIDQTGYFYTIGAGLSYQFKKLPLKFSIIPYEWQHGKISGNKYRGNASYLTISVYNRSRF